jgi:hypothetical protein
LGSLTRLLDANFRYVETGYVPSLGGEEQRIATLADADIQNFARFSSLDYFG